MWKYNLIEAFQPQISKGSLSLQERVTIASGCYLVVIYLWGKLAHKIPGQLIRLTWIIRQRRCGVRIFIKLVAEVRFGSGMNYNGKQ